MKLIPDDDDENYHGVLQRFLITNPRGFADDVKREIEREDEIGESPVIKFLDDMCMAAVGEGSEYVEEPNNMAADESPFDERAKVWSKA
jgi:hypothetical protein